MADDPQADVTLISRIGAVPIILDVVCQATGMGFAAVARVTEEKWIACATRDQIQFGLEAGGELDLKTTICDEIRISRSPVVIDDVTTDANYCKHHTPARYGFRSYISMPIFRGDGSFFGTLCAIDPKPAHVSKRGIVDMFRLFADLIGFHLDTEDRLADSARTIAAQEISQDLRDQFIAVLGHDLRNPLASIDAGMSLLQKARLDEKSTTTVALVRRSVKRMAELVDNVLDFARGRLGGGITINKSRGVTLEPILQLVVEEIRSSHQDRPISVLFELNTPVICDSARIGQMLSNLLANAITHGDEDGQISVVARSDVAHFSLEVANAGAEIEPDVLPHLFKPFRGTAGGRRREGLGLGLYICAEIARAHDGRIDVYSDRSKTTFTFVMPQAT